MARVLVVDDDEEYRGIVAGALKRAGHSVVEAGTIGEGLEAFRREKPEAAVLDAQLPDGDGFQLCAKLRKEPGGDRLPILLCTVRGSFEDVAEGLEAGPDDYVVKPFDDEDLVSRLAAATAARRA